MINFVRWLKDSLIPEDGTKILFYNDCHGYVVGKTSYYKKTNTVTITDQFGNTFSPIWKKYIMNSLK
jgi:hypothetical protein